MSSRNVINADHTERLFKVADLDRRLAVIVIGLPALGTAAALLLAFRGLKPTATSLALCAIFYVLSMIGIECGYHRLFTHRAFKASPFIESLLAVLGSFAFQGPVIWWAATHRRHHHFADVEGDPHSPHLTTGTRKPGFWGRFWHGHLGWLFQRESTRPTGWSSYVKDLYRKDNLFAIHMGYFGWLLAGYAIPTAIGGLIDHGWRGALLGFLWGGLVRTFFAHHFIWALNSVCHLIGSRPFSLGDDLSRNVSWLALPTLGQGWHNNHHAFPTSARVSFRWWQIDPTWWLIRAMAAIGLVSEIRSASPQQIEKRSFASETKEMSV